MKTIHKISLDSGVSTQLFEAHRNFKLLKFDVQNKNPCMWIEVDTRMDVVQFELLMFGTGQPIGYDDKTYLGTIFDKPYVWHYYLKGEYKCLK